MKYLLPVNVWGTEILKVPIAKRLEGDVFRVMGKSKSSQDCNEPDPLHNMTTFCIVTFIF